jgi:hypothetical protein
MQLKCLELERFLNSKEEIMKQFIEEMSRPLTSSIDDTDALCLPGNVYTMLYAEQITVCMTIKDAMAFSYPQFIFRTLT